MKQNKRDQLRDQPQSGKQKDRDLGIDRKNEEETGKPVQLGKEDRERQSGQFEHGEDEGEAIPS
jgi:hypothetical protein